MKKIFTLVSMAFVAMSMNAQVTWKAAEFDLSTATMTTLTEGIYGAGTAEAPDTSVPGSLNSSTIKVTLDGIEMTGESTPNGDKNLETADKAWELKGSVDGNDALITADCTPQFAKYLMPQGNPEFTHWEFDEETDNGTSHRVYGTYWEPGATAMPAKGAYYKFAVTKSGDLRVAIYGNKNQNPTYIVDETTKQPLDPATVTVSIYYQNTGFAYEGNAEEGTAKYFNVGPMAADYVLQHTNSITQNRPVLGFIDFAVEAGKTYWLFNPKSQIGIYGFYFAPGEGTGIANVKAELDADAPIFNLAGQQVSKDFKGVKVQNGRKFF
ncbi:MAG: hypothetical protein IJV38_10150 [Prevotella sp.]|nr:hypothetical protein [Prevotella sp.]